MAFDGSVVAALVKELNDTILDGRINKIAQPEEDELLFTIKRNDGNKRLLISASASLPLIYLTDVNKPSPAQAPAFCMLLRKHLSGARIIKISQPLLERVIHIDLEHRDELGDLCTKTIIIELMGKHSNIIFCKADGTIIDSIKHISAAVSSVREVLPGRLYFLPQTIEKINPLETCFEEFIHTMKNKSMPIFKAIYSSYVGLSPVISQEICSRADIDADKSSNAISDLELQNLYVKFVEIMDLIKCGEFDPQMIYENDIPVEFTIFSYDIYKNSTKKRFDSISELLSSYYSERNTIINIRQRSADLRRVVTTLLERNVKKYDLQIKQMKDTEKRDKYRVWGELINTYGYSVKDGDKTLEALNYYTNETILIPLDETLSASGNAQKYFDKYNKLKRTYEALETLTKEVAMEISHLESVLTALDIARSEEDLVEIRQELELSGVIRKKNTNKKIKITSKPFHYVTEDGFHIYVGKNNLQNDELTFKFANGNDWWFHAKKIPGSHVILKTEGKEIPDRVFEIAAAAAAFYCKGSDQQKVEVDYVKRKEVKKPAGAKPGFVVYYTNFSMAIEPGLNGLTQQSF